MNKLKTLERRLKDTQRIKKYLVRNNAPKTKISEITRLENHISEEINREQITNILVELYTK